jgi:hypothetical protein
VVPDRPITDPIDKSIPPVMITNATPILITPNREVQRSVFSTLYALKKLGLLIAVNTQTKINRPKIPNIFFMIL